VLIAMIAISAHAIIIYYNHSDKDDWRAATHYVLASAQRDDAALFFPRYVDAPFQYYRGSGDTTVSGVTAIYPRTLPVAEATDALASVQLEHGRLWAIFSRDGDAGAAIRDSLSRRYSVLSDSQFTGVRVVLYKLR